MSANPAYQPMIFTEAEASELNILGKLIGSYVPNHKVHQNDCGRWIWQEPSFRDLRCKLVPILNVRLSHHYMRFTKDLQAHFAGPHSTHIREDMVSNIIHDSFSIFHDRTIIGHYHV